ncbi:MAG: class III extradiol dioxygenase subunit beta [Methyloligellaceae bacterium]
MAKIVAGLGTSHVPAVGAAMDNGKTQEPYWKPLFDGYEPAREWLREVDPDVVIVVYNDHANAFSIELTPTFIVGAADQFKPADEGYGPRQVPIVHGHPDLANHIIEHLVLNEFDMTTALNMDVDHGLTVPLSVTCGQPDAWPFNVIPLAVNVIKYPQPHGRRCYALGKAIRQAVDSYEEDLKVVIFGTGGMSHQLQGERVGLINKEFDIAFLDDLTADVDRLLKIDHLEYMRDSGSEGIELIMWLIMRGALDDNVTEIYRHYHVPASNTAAGLIILENNG